MGTRRVLVIAFAFALLIGVSALAQGPPYGGGRTPPRARRIPTEWDARRPLRKSARWISPSARPEKNSRREKALPRRARSSIARRDARDATARRELAVRRPI